MLVHHEVEAGSPGADATVSLTKLQLLLLFGGLISLADQVAAGDITVAGDITSVAALAGLLDRPDPDFAIVTP